MCVGRIEELVAVCVHLCVQIGCVIHVCMCVCVYVCTCAWVEGEWLHDTPVNKCVCVCCVYVSV